MLAIFKREWKSHFTGMTGYVITAVLLAFVGLYFFTNCLIGGMADFALNLYYSVIVLLFLLPVLTMRSFAGERRAKTDQLLLTAPVGIPAIVLGKFFAALAVFAVPLAVIAAMPLVLSAFGKVLLGGAFASLLAFLLLAAAGIAVGLWVSSLVENQIVAYLAAFGLLLLSYMSGAIRSLFTSGSSTAFVIFCVVLVLAAISAGFVCKSLPVGTAVFAAGAVLLAVLFRLRPAWLVSAVDAMLSALDLFSPFYGFVGGMFSLTGVLYYLSVITLFLFLTGQTLDKRRWR